WRQKVEVEDDRAEKRRAEPQPEAPDGGEKQRPGDEHDAQRGRFGHRFHRRDDEAAERDDDDAGEDSRRYGGRLRAEAKTWHGGNVRATAAHGGHPPPFVNPW